MDNGDNISKGRLVIATSLAILITSMTELPSRPMAFAPVFFLFPEVVLQVGGFTWNPSLPTTNKHRAKRIRKYRIHVPFSALSYDNHPTDKWSICFQHGGIYIGIHLFLVFHFVEGFQSASLCFVVPWNMFYGGFSSILPLLKLSWSFIPYAICVEHIIFNLLWRSSGCRKTNITLSLFF